MIAEISDHPATILSEPGTASSIPPAGGAEDRTRNCESAAPALLFSVPPNDPAFARIPHECRVDVRLTLNRLKQIHFAKNKTREFQRIAATLQAGCNTRRGLSPRQLKRLYYLYTSADYESESREFPPGDWRCVVDWAKAGPRSKDSSTSSDLLPAEFVAKVWRLLCDKHQRVISSARRELVQIWRTGFDNDGNRWKSIPGYSDWPQADPRTGLPSGWGDRNLYRYTPDKFERTAARQGIQAASTVGFKISKSRFGLKVLEQTQYDDHEFNAKIMFPGQARAFRPRCFAGADALCSRMFKIVNKPTFWNLEEEAKKVLTETDFMWFHIACLTDVGYRVDDRGTLALIEHGTTALRPELSDRFTEATRGKVRYARSGRFHNPAHKGQFAPPSGGNPNFKGIIEVFWRMLDDRLDSLPGQVGKDRLHAPEELERADAYVAKLLKAAAALDPQRAAELIIPRLTWDEFAVAVWNHAAALDCEPRHDIQDWERCGFVIKEFRRSPDALEWHPVCDLPKRLESFSTDQALAVVANDACNRVRRLTRMEAWQREYLRDREAGLIERLAPSSIPDIVGPRHALTCNGSPFHSVRNGVITVEDQLVDPDPMEYLAVSQSGDRFREGDKFVCYRNPMSPDCLILCDDSHRFVSVCPLAPRPAANDFDGIKAASGLQRSWYARALAPMRERHAPDAAALGFMRKHNAAILDGGKTEAEKQRGKTISRAALSPETLLDAEPASVHAASSEESRSASDSFDPSELL